MLCLSTNRQLGVSLIRGSKDLLDAGQLVIFYSEYYITSTLTLISWKSRISYHEDATVSYRLSITNPERHDFGHIAFGWSFVIDKGILQLFTIQSRPPLTTRVTALSTH